MSTTHVIPNIPVGAVGKAPANIPVGAVGKLPANIPVGAVGKLPANIPVGAAGKLPANIPIGNVGGVALRKKATIIGALAASGEEKLFKVLKIQITNFLLTFFKKKKIANYVKSMTKRTQVVYVRILC